MVDKGPNLLGLPALTRLNLIKRVDSNVAAKYFDMRYILREYADLFSPSLGEIPYTHSIKLQDKVNPVVHPPRRVPVALKYQIQDELKRMGKMGVIVKVVEPTDWVNSMVIDPTDLNKAIKRAHYPMKTIEEVIANIPKARYFSVLDAKSGYWQIKLDEYSSKFCTFNTPFGRYRFKCC